MSSKIVFDLNIGYNSAILPQPTDVKTLMDILSRSTLVTRVNDDCYAVSNKKIGFSFRNEEIKKEVEEQTANETEEKTET